MPDGPGAPVAHCGDQLRRIMAERRRTRRRLLIGALVGCSAVPLGASIMWKAPVLLG
jgi:hypothetical protein